MLSYKNLFYDRESFSFLLPIS